MAKFLKGNELNSELEKIFDKAEESIILISPYIKLHNRIKSVLRSKLNDPQIEVTVVFGKNEEDLSKSMQEEDFNFLKEFPNIEIRYEKRLHAKYYANEKNAILTSMNLHSFSQDNNIEAGVLFTISDKVDNDAWDYFNRVIDQSELLFQRNAHFDKALFGLSKKYKESITAVDHLSDFFSNRPKYDSNERFKSRTVIKNTEPIQLKATNKTGYCIRTGKPIAFNPKRPLCDEAYQNWLKFSNQDYEEKFCHFSGEPSNGETSFSKPILKKNWKEAKDRF
jgi:hypothetical protein